MNVAGSEGALDEQAPTCQAQGCKVRLLTWNVNGLRACVNKFQGGLAKMLDTLDADVICFQEHKLLRKDLEQGLALVDGWESFFAFSRGSTGYSGVATFCRRSAGVPVHAEEGLTGVLELQPAARAQVLSNPMWSGYTVEQLMAIDQEGRVIITDHGEFVLFNIYGPCLSNEEKAEERLAIKLLFFKALQARVEALQAAGRRCVVAGDFNICPKPADFREPESDDIWFAGDASTSLVSWLRSMSHDGPEGGSWVDTFRLFHPDRLHAYTCWRMQTGARANNWGSRIDLIMAIAPDGLGGEAARREVLDWVVRGDVWPELQGSDHAPAWVTLQFARPLPTLPANARLPPLSTRYMFTGKQARLTHFFSKPASSQLPGIGNSSTPVQGVCTQPAVVLGQTLPAGTESADTSNCFREFLNGSSALARQGPAVSEPAPSNSGSQAHSAQGHQQQSAALAPFQPAAISTSASAAAQRRQHPPSGVSQPTRPPASKGRGGQRSGGKAQALLTSFRFVPKSCPPSAAPSSTSLPPGQQTRAQSQGVSTSGAGAGSSQQASSGLLATGVGHQVPRQAISKQGQTAASQQKWGQTPLHPSNSTPTFTGEGTDQGPSDSQASQQWAEPAPCLRPPSQSSQQHDNGTQPEYQGACLQQGHGTQQQPQAMALLSSQAQGDAWQPCHAHLSASNSSWQDRETDNKDAPQPMSGCSLPQPTASQQLSRDRQEGQGQGLDSRAAAYGTPATNAASLPAAAGVGVNAATGIASAGQSDSSRRAEAAKAWRTIQERMKAPHCLGHNEPAVIRQVKKSGPNVGRCFYVCARADGPPPVGRCDFFVWADNRGGKGSGGRGAGRGNNTLPTKKPKLQ